MAKIKAISIKRDATESVITIENSLEAFERYVEGPLGLHRPFQDNVILLCNDQGKIQRLLPTKIVSGDDGFFEVFVGNLLLCGLDEQGCICSLSPHQQQMYLNDINFEHRFIDPSEVSVIIDESGLHNISDYIDYIDEI